MYYLFQGLFKYFYRRINPSPVIKRVFAKCPSIDKEDVEGCIEFMKKDPFYSAKDVKIENRFDNIVTVCPSSF